MKKWLFLFVFSFSIEAKVYYTNRQFIHLHKNPSIHSVSLTSLSCSSVIKKEIVKGKEIDEASLWAKVSVGNYTGFVKKKLISTKKIKCFGNRYPVIFNSLDLSMVEIYRWGRLNDLLVEDVVGIN